MANLLAGRGLAAGDRICVYLPNCLEFIDLFLAATRLG
jgi:acyl-coenzyme A synthetase/AMP-(fatty) acid ligase